MGTTLLTIAGLPVTTYAAGMTLSLAVCVLAAFFFLKKAGINPQARQRFVLLALPLSLLFARLLYVLIRLPFFLTRPDGLAFRFWQGGYTFWGAIAGVVLAARITAATSGIAPAALLDALAPSALLMLALGRFCEGLAGQGFGEEALAQLQFFPVAITNEWGEWNYAIFLLEGVAALVFLGLVLFRKNPKPLSRFKLSLILVCAFQILFESLREDEYLRWGFVRVGQLIAVLILFYLLVDALFITKDANWRSPRHFAVTLFLLLTIVLIALEFALDKTNLPTLPLYGIMMAAVAGKFALLNKTAVGQGPARAGSHS
ncbi:MAG: hypothetical protein GXZ04_06690 [Clostridiales bacterium]|nr:hypothetical protein [Clostridiales bacterium]